MLSTARANVEVGPRNGFTTAAVLAGAILVTGTSVAASGDYRSSVDANWETHQQVVAPNQVSSQDMVKSVLSAFGLAVKDFEPILGVKRAAIYNWKKGANEPNEVQFAILRRLHEVSILLDSKGVKIGRLAKTNVYQNTSLLEKLSSPSIDVQSVVEHHEFLVSKVLKQKVTFESVSSSETLVEGDSFVSVERS
ncbi:hypothetical protein [Vibrio sp. Hep-1b-8]|uniref:hypothetical protein n=1 Tax=Vibrio sp. Hep-1b-8 TaxID=2144187 RepID=UPI001110781A|nr:hypothetical protein [Vibrio sp. Hep-1b-8]TMX34631.1 hypothetical protein DA100_15520 [Vibrio sp. Hep-1b-8]